MCQVIVTACGIKFPDQGWNPGLLHWEHRVSATGVESFPLPEEVCLESFYYGFRIMMCNYYIHSLSAVYKKHENRCY